MPSSGYIRTLQARRRRADPAYREAENKARRERGPRAGHLARPFVGIDGEGGTIDGHHHYMLLRAGDRTVVGDPLTAAQCLAFIADLPRDPHYVGYFFDYDVTMILRGLPHDRVARVLDRDKRMSTTGSYCWPVDVQTESGDFQVDYLPHKELKVRRVLDREGRRYAHWSVVNDVGSFFQCSFVAALTQWDIGTPEERAAIAKGKEQRADFAALSDETDMYNALEIRLLERLMSRFREACQEVGYVPSRWQGPGNMAQVMLRRHSVPRTRDLPIPPAVALFGQEAYFGGRFETTHVGPVYGGVHQYDICSAYPDAIASVLPCLMHGSWVRRGDRARPHIARGTFVADERAALYGYPFRNSKGNISYPGAGTGTYWSYEIAAAKHQTFTYDDWWTYEPACSCDTFGWVDGVYQARLALGKTAKGRVLKLSTNSLYGKMCQSIGQAPYANPVYASLITAYVRAKLGDAVHQDCTPGDPRCDDVVMLATDALFSRRPRVLPVSTRLGDWDHERHETLFIVQPGLYFTDKHDQPKTRGVPRQAVVDHRQAFYDAYADLCFSGDVFRSRVTVPLRQFVGLRIAHARGKLGTAGEWVDTSKEIGFEWTTKRDPFRTSFDRSHDLIMPELRTYPPEGCATDMSVAYSKDIGRMAALARLESGDGPDWADILYGEEL